MSMKLKVRLRHSEGALVRLLGQIGRRGYDVLGVTARLATDGKTFDVLVEFDCFVPMSNAPRPAAVLPSLCRKLVEVESAELVESGPRPAADAPGNGSAHAPQPPAARPAGDMKWEE